MTAVAAYAFVITRPLNFVGGILGLLVGWAVAAYLWLTGEKRYETPPAPAQSPPPRPAPAPAPAAITDAPPPTLYQAQEPFANWESDTFVGGLTAVK